VLNLAPRALVLRYGFWKEAADLSGGLTFDRYSDPATLLKTSEVMIIPTGALAGVSKDIGLRMLVESYVSSGGTLLVLSQQWGAQVNEFVPGASTFQIAGFREDPSCMKRSLQYSVGIADVGVDGWFSSDHDDQKTEIRYYRYKKGAVLLTSLFTDWAAAHSQASPSELKFFRYLVEAATILKDKACGKYLPTAIRPPSTNEREWCPTSMRVKAAFDRPLYNPGDKATMAITITESLGLERHLDIVVGWNSFYHKQRIQLKGNQRIKVEIPIERPHPDKVSVGVYNRNGKALYLDDYYLRVRGNEVVTALLDRLRYKPGDRGVLTLSSVVPGKILLGDSDLFENQEWRLPGPVSVPFTIPDDQDHGPNEISWNFSPSEPGFHFVQESIEYEVAGHRAKVAKCSFDKESYRPGDTVTVDFLLDTNFDGDTYIRYWIYTSPYNSDWAYLGYKNLKTSSCSLTPASVSFRLQTERAGPHRFVYVLYKLNREGYLREVAEQALYFYVQGAELLTVRPDKFRYQTGKEDVEATAVCLGTGTATLEWQIHGETIVDSPVELNGVTRIRHRFPGASIPHGYSWIYAKLIQGNLSSRQHIIVYHGKEQTDLLISGALTKKEERYFTFSIDIGNYGQLPSPPTIYNVLENGVVIHSAPVPALQANERKTFAWKWDTFGKAGMHILHCVVDPYRMTGDRDYKNNIKKIYDPDSERDNSNEIVVPDFYFTLLPVPEVWKHGDEVTFQIQLVNNRWEARTLELTVTVTDIEEDRSVFRASERIVLPPIQERIITFQLPRRAAKPGKYSITCGAYHPEGFLRRQTAIMIKKEDGRGS
jgi:hypothetical protein